MPRYSQNFLINGRIADFIVEHANLTPQDIVLEIGPGRGILTERLLKKSRVVAVEIDPELYDALNLIFSDEIKSGKLQIILGDALEIDFPAFTKVIANIPYHISSPLIFKILEYEFEEGIIMVQKEFAERLVARKGSKKYGRLSVMMYYHGSAEILKVVKRGNFRPVPKVDSAVVRIKKENRFCADPQILDCVVKKIFSQRRKKIKNILGDVPYGEMRAEELSPEEICEVANYAHRFCD